MSFVSGTTTRQLLQERDGRILVAAWRVVVGLGDVLAETHDRLVVLHGKPPIALDPPRDVRRVLLAVDRGVVRPRPHPLDTS